MLPLLSDLRWWVTTTLLVVSERRFEVTRVIDTCISVFLCVCVWVGIWGPKHTTDWLTATSLLTCGALVLLLLFTLFFRLFYALDLNPTTLAHQFVEHSEVGNLLHTTFTHFSSDIAVAGLLLIEWSRILHMHCTLLVLVDKRWRSNSFRYPGNAKMDGSLDVTIVARDFDRCSSKLDSTDWLTDWLGAPQFEKASSLQCLLVVFPSILLALYTKYLFFSSLYFSAVYNLLYLSRSTRRTAVKIRNKVVITVFSVSLSFKGF